MGQAWLISGSPGCGKTHWILNTFKNHKGSCAYIRLNGYSDIDLEQVKFSKIDSAFLKDHLPHLIDVSNSNKSSISIRENTLLLIELPQFKLPSQNGVSGIDPRVLHELEILKLQPNRYLHFGRDIELPTKDTLDFKKIESSNLNLQGCIWDPPSLNTFWFELVNGAYGDVYRAKALMNLPDGRCMFFNWIVSQQGSQYLPLNGVAPLTGRPERHSEIVIQGKNLDFALIQSTINHCLLDDSVLAYHQASLRSSELQPIG
ncbi:GTP-binding protein [Prochlorococcus sp. MIT 1223]|uniref:GTP-binding protein n=1 Tax=Prochlorococcus sp. MIT 1223 TaxID=3096217 RepID=UPI002A752728|nr:GTP-binding protein [Prochlorococcus sp. MIT 1223]